MQVNLEPMLVSQSEAVIDLIARAMNADEAIWARQTLAFYFDCMAKKLNPGREYFVIRDQHLLIGIVGLHHYRWGPPQNVWLSWFAVDPGQQGRGYARAMLTAIEEHARQRGYRQFFIETYASPEFEKALGFYRHMGFHPAGHIDHYLADGSQMRVMHRTLSGSD
jgi:GNAT superfamily N-acetyltransferase